MAQISKTKYTAQAIENMSFDDGLKVKIVELIGADGSLKNPATEEKQDALIEATHAEDSAHVTGDKGIPMWGVRVDAYPPDGGVFGADGDYTPIATNYKGDVKTSVQDSALPTGAATEAKQDDIVSAIGNITIPAPVGGATETTQESVLSILEERLGDLSIVLRAMMQSLNNPPWLDRSVNQLRAQVTGSLTTAGTVSTVSTVTNMSQIDTYQGKLLITGISNDAWANVVRRTIS